MRLVSWNVCDAFERKFGHLERLSPGIAILQEVRPGCLARAGLSDRAIWTGDDGQKGLAAIGYGGWSLERAPFEIPEKWFIPVVARNGSDRVHILAVWTDSRSECAPPTIRVLEHLRSFLGEAPSLVAGDFNHSVGMDRRKGPGRRFADVLATMGSIGLASAWHGFHGQEHGKESQATLYWRWNAEQRFHIDFVFHSAGLIAQDVSIGSFEKYVAAEISDHVPVTVEFALST